MHGKYLIKLLDKVKDRDDLPVYPHGTSVKVTLRPSAEIDDVLSVAKAWLMFPRCKVTVQMDDEDPIEIGFSSPKEALEAYLASSFRRGAFASKYEVREAALGDLTVAFAVEKDELFKTWGFVQHSADHRSPVEEETNSPSAVCVEGVAVEAVTPGFRSKHILAVANAVGKTAPKTNVARSALEDTNEYHSMLENIYRIYCEHVTSEIGRLRSEEGYSLSRAAGEVPYLAAPLTSESTISTRRRLLWSEMSKIPLVLAEEGRDRFSVSLEALVQRQEFWTTESPLYRSAESFVRDAPTDVSASRVLETLGNAAGAQMQGTTVCNLSSDSFVKDVVGDSFEIVEMVASRSARRLDLKWVKVHHRPLWFSSVEVRGDLVKTDAKFANVIKEGYERLRGGRFSGAGRLVVPCGEVQVTGLADTMYVIAYRDRYLVPGTKLARYLAGMRSDMSADGMRVLASHLQALDILLSYRYQWSAVTEDLLDRMLVSQGAEAIRQYLRSVEAFVDAVRSSGDQVFDPYAWERRSSLSSYYNE